jgi:hypothetical protein
MKGKALFGMFFAFCLGYTINAHYTLALGDYANIIKAYAIVGHVVIVSVIIILIVRERTM